MPVSSLNGQTLAENSARPQPLITIGRGRVRKACFAGGKALSLRAMCTRRPNIVFVNWHDTGRHFGCYGIPTVSTPNVDRLAAEGVLFEQAFTCAVVCSPSRGAMFTGRYPQANGMLGLCHGAHAWTLHEGEKHLSQLLREAGYHTTLQGFQHEVNKREIETLQGFDVCRNHLASPPTWQVPPCDVIAHDAAAFLRDYEEDRPFYIQMGFFETHRPYDFGNCAPDAEKGVTIPPYIIDTEGARTDHAALQGAIKKADAALGSFLKALDESPHRDDTIVVFTIDHGLANPRAKATLHDPGMEVALVVRWPAGQREAGLRTDRLVSNVDLTPTLFELAGLEPRPNFQGMSFADAITGDYPEAQIEASRDAVYAMYDVGDRRCIRTRTHKLIRNFTAMDGLKCPVDIEDFSHPILQWPCARQGVGLTQFYDLSADPLETTDLSKSADHAEAFAALDRRLWQWMEDVGDPILDGPIAPPRYHQNMAQRPKQ